jgi:hypothetical protein
MDQCGKKGGFLFVKDVGLFDRRIRNSEGGAYVRAAIEVSAMDCDDIKQSDMLNRCAKDSSSPDGETYDFKALLKKWRHESTLAKWLGRQRRDSAPTSGNATPGKGKKGGKHANAAQAAEEPDDDGNAQNDG